MGCSTKCPPTRALIFAMLFTACVYSYILRVNLSLSLIAMVEKTGGKNFTPECATDAQKTQNKTQIDYGERYDWDQKMQGLILGAYFYGYTFTCIPGGFFAERYGPVQTIGVSMFISAVMTGLTPLAASIHWTVVLVVRAILGIVGGVQFPAVQCAIAHWAPPNEKSKFVFALLGGTFGMVITWPILATTIMAWGWAWSFYLTAISTLIFTVAWYFLTTDTPEKHKCISDEEKKFISESLGASVSATKSKMLPPYKKMFTSVPVWALIVAQFGNQWGLYLLMTAGPKFMAEVLGFNLRESGVLASIPYLNRMVWGFGFASLCDFLRSRKYMTVSNIRRWFTIFSHILPGVFLIMLFFTGCDQFWAVALITIAMGFNGATTTTQLSNAQDLAPNFAGSIYGIANCIGGTTGFITPFITGVMTQDKNGLHEWHIIFLIGAIAYMTAGVIFMIFGTGEELPWNRPQAEDETELK